MRVIEGGRKTYTWRYKCLECGREWFSNYIKDPPTERVTFRSVWMPLVRKVRPRMIITGSTFVTEAEAEQAD